MSISEAPRVFCTALYSPFMSEVSATKISRGILNFISFYLFICICSHLNYKRSTHVLRKVLRSIIKVIKTPLILLIFCYSSFQSFFSVFLLL